VSANPVSQLTELAISVFSKRQAPPDFLISSNLNRLIGSLRRFVVTEPSHDHISPQKRPEMPGSPDFEMTAQAILSDPDLAPTFFKEGEPHPMIFVGNSGNRLSPADLIESLFTAAFQQMHYLRLPLKESTFARLVIEG